MAPVGYNKNMRFNAYFAEINHPDISFTGNVIIEGKTITANFKKVEDKLFIIFFKNQVGLRFKDNIKFKSNRKNITILLPVLSKYNKRRLKKIAQVLHKPQEISETDIILEILDIEKFFNVTRLLDFFSLDKKIITELLIEKELERKIKIIDFHSLYITSYDHYQNFIKELKSLFQHHYENRIKSIKFSEIESRIKISQSSIFFKYLLNSFEDTFSFTILKDKILLQKLSFSEKEEAIINDIEKILKKNKLAIFTIDDIFKHSSYTFNDINNPLWYMVEEGKLLQLNKSCFMFGSDFNRILNRLKKFKRNQGETIDIQSFRELTFFNRKSIITLLEYLDSQQITQRIGNKRKILLGV
jgi:hypothetical protein